MKPTQILKLEKELGLELTETKNPDDILPWGKSKIYLLNDTQEIVGLNLHACGLRNLAPLQALHNLERLDLRGNKISDLAPLQALHNLQKLWLSDNQISHISLAFLNNFPQLVELHIHGNPISNIPKEIFDKEYENVLGAVRDYLESVAKESRSLNEGKVNIVGVGEVGKSELTDALSDLGYQFNEKRQSTQGIRIKVWEFPLEEKAGANLTFRANIWDFAGQNENYNTHQFFLAKNSVNLFVWETRKGEQESKFAYWLNIISLLSENAPILVVQNKIDVYESETNQKAWRDSFPHIIDFYKTSCKTGQGIAGLRQAVQKALAALPHTQVRWNPERFKVREILENHDEEYIDLKTYLELCARHGLNREQAFYLSEQLHELGIILHYGKDSLLRNTVVLKSEWAIDAAYCLIDTKKVKQGRFQKRDLDRIWADERFEYKHDFLLELMKKFELLFQFQESDTYIVPDGLPINPAQDIEGFMAKDREQALRFEYHYDFMPKGILSRLICRLHHHIKGDWFWRYGVVLAYEENTTAIITLNEVESQIKIILEGKKASILLSLIRSHIAYIHATLKNPPLKEMIPCYCEKCKEKNTHFFEYNYLKMCSEEGDSELRCGNRTKVSIARMLEGIINHKGNRQQLIDLIDLAKVSDFFEQLESMGTAGYTISSLRKEFIHDGGRDFRYADRLKAWVMEHFK